MRENVIDRFRFNKFGRNQQHNESNSKKEEKIAPFCQQKNCQISVN